MDKRKRPWRTVTLDDNGISEGDFQGFYCFEELSEYTEDDLAILRGNAKGADAVLGLSRKKKRKRKLLEKSKDELSTPSAEVVLPSEGTSTEKTSKNRKAKRKKKKLQKESSTNCPAGVALSGEPIELSREPRDLQENKEEATYEREKTSANTLFPNMEDWAGLGVPPEVLRALAELKFTSPTNIQSAVLPPAIFYRQDIIGAAETGSGKTLAFGIPIVSHILRLKSESMMNDAFEVVESKGKGGSDVDLENQNTLSDVKQKERPLYALILAPTRELAIQVKDHITNAIKHTSLKCVSVVGGLAPAKQQRLLQKCPEIVVGTPGRLYKLLTDGQDHLSKLSTLKYLVIDEVDRMLEHGHFKDLASILDRIQKAGGKRQCFMFSATLTIPQYHKDWKKRRQAEKKNEVQTLVDKIGLDPKAKVVDLTTKHVAAELLKQQRVVCTEKEKDLYLYYFLLTRPGRTLVFVNSISSSRRLCAILDILGMEPLQLHAGKQQRQRLKALDRFKERDRGLLVATDVAARGLDIPFIKNVVHYHLPKDPKMYIHRSGRTARAAREGLSLVLEGPSDVDAYKRICHLMKTDQELELFDIDTRYFPGLKKRLELAYKVDKVEHKVVKTSADKNWYKRTANDLDTDVRDFHFEDEDEQGVRRMNLKVLRKQLTSLLKIPLIPTGFSGAFPTKYGELLKPGLPVVS